MAHGGPVGLELPGDLRGRTVGEAMLSTPDLMAEGARVADAAAYFEDDHVHAALVVDGSGRLLEVVERADLVGRSALEPLRGVGSLAGRTAGPEEDLAVVGSIMLRRGARRVAVVDGAARLLGLLCLKGSGLGFCSDADVAERAADRGARACL